MCKRLLQSLIRIALCGVALAALRQVRAQEAVPADPLPRFVSQVATHRDGHAAWSIDFAALEGERRELPIGVFDSGIGGLTVLEAILRLDQFNNDTLRPGADGRPDFAGERFIYFGDQANMPYGNYPAQGRTDLLRELILKDVVFLLGTRWRTNATAAVQRGKPPVKAIVVACNTATAYGLDDVRAALRQWKLDLPLIGVVEAGARAVAELLPEDGARRSVAVLATVATCSSQAYPKAIRGTLGQAGKRAPALVQHGSLGLAGAIDGNPAFVSDPSRSSARTVPYEGPAPDHPLAPLDARLWNAYQFSPDGLLKNERSKLPQLNSVPNYARYDVITLLEAHRRSGHPPIGTVVLGCTHFPLAQSELADAFRLARRHEAPDGTRPYAGVVLDEIQFIDPAESTARELFLELARARLRNKQNREPPAASFFISVPNPEAPGVRLAADGSLDPHYKVARATGRFETEDAVAVPLTVSSLPSSSANLVRALPAVWKALQTFPAAKDYEEHAPRTFEK